MIHIFPASFVGQVTKLQCRRLTFEIDDANKDLSKEIGNSSQGQQFLIVAYDMADMGDVVALKNDKQAAKQAMMKRLHAKLGEYVRDTGIEKDILMNVLRLRLQHRGKISASLSELDDVGIAQAIYLLDTELHPTRFDYEAYANNPAEKH